MTTKISDTEMRRFRSLLDQFRKIDRIMTSDLGLHVRFPDENDADEASMVAQGVPAWSLHPYIVINPAAFDNFKDSTTLVGLLGVNYHELAHILFSPSVAWKRANILSVPSHRQMMLRHAYHILEDSRIESFFTARYQPAGKYFTQMVVNVIINGPRAHWESAFLLTYGRSYLPLEIRDEFEARYAYPEKIQRVKELCDEYKKFRAYHFDHKPAAVMRVLNEFADLIQEDAEENPQLFSEDENCASESHNSGDQNEDAEKDAQQKEKKRREKEERTGEDQSGFWEEDDEEDQDAASASEDEPGEDSGPEDDDESDGEDDGDSSDEEGDGDGEADGDGEGSESSDSGDSESDGSGDGDEGDEEGESGDGDADSDDQGDSEPEDGDDGSGIGSSGDLEEYEQPESAFENKELASYLEEIIEAVNEDEGVQRELRNILAAMNDFNVITPPEFTIPPARVDAPNPVMMNTIEMSQQELRRLYAETEPGWRSDSDTGRLNFARFMEEPDDFDGMFDEWDEGREEDTGLEAVLALDMSSSMGSGVFRTDGMIEPASEMLYAIKRSLDEIDAKVTVIGWGGNTVASLYDRNEKVGVEVPYFSAQSWGTVVAPALHFARRTLATSTMPNKLFVCLTDGGWHYNDPEDEDEMIQRRFNHNSIEGPAHAAELIDQIPGIRMYIGLGPSDANAECRSHFDVVSTHMQPHAVPEMIQRAVVAMLQDVTR